jgi:hypothetical protein
VVLCLDSPPTDDEFVGVADYVSESFHDLLTGESETISDSDSDRGSHHPSLECFIADSPEGHVKSPHDGNTPPDISNDRARERNQAPPCVWLEQPWEWQKELEEAHLHLEHEHGKLKREIGRCGDGECARANAREVNRRILKDDKGPPLFTRVSQNIAVARALLEGLLEPVVPEARCALHKLRTLLEHVA